MQVIALGVRILLALVFATAAAGKLADLRGTRTTLAEFGVPETASRPLALLLPLAEVATVVGLLVQASARWGALAALVLLAVFAAGIAGAMARGEAPDCHCFGQISSAPAGRSTLIRNAVLALPAVFVVAYGPGRSLSGWLSARSAAELVAIGLGIALAALVAFCFRLQSENKRLQSRVDRQNEWLSAFPPGLPVGANAPRFALPSVGGETVTMDALLARGNPVALVFVSSGCAPCLAILPDIARWQRQLADRITIALPGLGKVSELQPLADQYGLRDVLADEKSEVLAAFRGGSTPSVVIVGADGKIGSRLRSTHAIVEALIRHTLSDESLRSAPEPAASSGSPFEVLQTSLPGRA